MPLLEIKKLSFTYVDGARALERVDFALEAGEICLLCGASGAGKSTLMRLIKNLPPPAGERSGEIIFGGGEVSACSPRRLASEIGLSAQDARAGLCADTPRGEICFGMENLGLDEPSQILRLAGASNEYGLAPELDRSFSELSDGRAAAVSLAALLALRPRLLLLDEPLARLDTAARRAFVDILTRYLRESGAAALISCQELEPLMEASGRIAVLSRGRMVFDGSREAGCEWLRAESPLTLPAWARLSHIGAPAASVAGARRALAALAGKLTLNPRRVSVGEEPLLTAEKLRFGYGGAEVLRGLSLELRAGAVTAVTGANGSGKTTLLRILSGLEKPRAGRVSCRVRRALLPSRVRLLFAHETLGECAADFPNADKTASRYALFSDIEELYDKNLLDLSGGQAQKAALFLALCSGAQVLLLDEPDKGLDPASTQSLGEALRGLAASGAAIAFTTHSNEFAAAAADRVALLFDGRIDLCAPPHGFFEGAGYYSTALSRVCEGVAPAALLPEELEKKA